MSLKDSAAVVGVGVHHAGSPSLDGLGAADLAILATEAALDDAGLTRKDLAGFAWNSGFADPGGLAAAMGVPEVSFSANLTSGAGGGAGGLGLAAAAINGGFADVCLTLVSIQQAPRAPGRSSSATRPRAAAGPGAYGIAAGPDPDQAFSAPAGLLTQAQHFAMIANGWMRTYGVTREHLGQVVITQHDNAAHGQGATPGPTLTLEEYLKVEMISDPLSSLDCTPELDGSFAVAVISASVERARDLRHPPVLISAAVTGGAPLQPLFQSVELAAGHREMAGRLYQMAGLEPSDVDVALLYDDFSPAVLMQLEDYGFCEAGGAASFVADGSMRYGAKLPVNTHGGNLSDAYTRGATHVVEAVEQIRGTAARPVEGCEVVLVTGAPGMLPVSAAILKKAS